MKKGLIASLVLLLLAGCATSHHTELLSVSRDKSSTGGFSKVFVMAVNDDGDVRKQVEGIVAESLKKQGAEVVIASEAMPGDIESLGKTEIRARAEKAVKESGADSALVLLLVKDEVREQYVEPVAVASPTPTAPVYMGFGPYVGYQYDTVMTPGYFSKQRELFVQSSLYDANTGQPVWRAQSKTIDPTGLQESVTEFSDVLSARLKQDGMLGSKAPAMRGGAGY